MGLAWVESLKGTTQKGLKGLCAKQDGNYSRVLRALKKGEQKKQGFTWKFSEGKGKSFKIYNVKKK